MVNKEEGCHPLNWITKKQKDDLADRCQLPDP